MTQRQKYLLSRAYDAASELADAYDTHSTTGLESDLRLVDERVRSFIDCREDCKQENLPREAIKSLYQLLPWSLQDRLLPA